MDPDGLRRFITGLLGEARQTYDLRAMRIADGVSLDIRTRPPLSVRGADERTARLQIVGAATVRIVLDGRFESDEVCDDPQGWADILEEFLGFARAYLADDGDWRSVRPGFGVHEALAFDSREESRLFTRG
ncbi:hypothetical protein GCM10009821_26340 [Aeromicrobium halocynthiae]|uniref:Uncharacterized protein n=1 Tax=Aeromicrobium halocynthiae TaxID=560557 RepID=A0ABP5HPX4_9ACTN